MKLFFNSTNFSLTYSQSHVDSQILWENHCHTLYEMIAVLKGNVNITLEGRTYRLKENTMIIIPPLCYHMVSANKTGDYQRITAFFSKTAIPSVLQEDFTRRDVSPVICSIPWSNEIRGIFKSNSSPYYEPLVNSMMTQLFYQRIEAPDATDIDAEADQYILQIISYINDHLLDQFVLDDLAKHTAHSKSYVCHLFEEKMGIPPKQYVLQKRMAYAEMQIRDGHPATAVASELGYKSYASFYRMYQKHCGVNPLKSKISKS